MVIRVLLSTILGAAIYYFAAMASWMALPYHMNTLHHFAKEDVVIKSITESAPTSGIYVSPNFGELKAVSAGEKPAPVVFLSIKHEGQDLTMHTQMIQDSVLCLVGAFLISLLLLYAARTSYFCRVGFVVIVGLTVGILGQLNNYIWWGYDFGYLWVNVMDSTVCWGLAALVMAAIIKKKKEA